ncbi:HVA22-like protein j [Platanthera guangdongensis]|uniref:HVA22-like protein n=1 Tax=Platanthera guangdongensis TaxID=2320717 RepID=A0ABR2M3T0_9ASPA
MLGEFVTRVLVLVLGYAYPAFECFKLMEKSKIDVQQLLFWCEYWVIVAIVTIFERFFDIFVSWLPLYGETKLAFFIYLWHPKTRGTRWVYEAFLRPLVTQHEPDIEQKLQSYRARAGDLLLFYIKNFTEQGQSLFLEMLHYITSSNPNSKKSKRSGSSGSDDPLAIRRSGNGKEDFSYSPEMEEALRAAQGGNRRSRPRH